MTDFLSLEGGCACGHVRYQLLRAPMFVHCCHCTCCQTETGSAFAINAMVESDQVELLEGEVESIDTPSPSGLGQLIVRCPACKVAVWSHYGGARQAIKFVRVGSLDEPDACPPDIHIYTSTKQNWVQLSAEVPVVEEYYQRSKYWPPDSIARFKKV